MKKLSLKLENCYGIKKLDKEIDFSTKRTAVIYSANGVMKTSFSKTFLDISKGNKPKDLVYTSKEAIFDVIDDSTSSQIEKDNIFVVEPYNDESFRTDQRMITLLVKKELREEYQEIYSDLEKNKNEFLKRLKKASSSTDCEKEMFATFSDISSENLFEILKAIKDEVSKSKDVYTFRYNDVFDPTGKVKEFLGKHNELLSDYVTKYAEIIAQNSFFKKTKKGTFGTAQANDVLSSTKDGTFFSAGHSLDIDQRGKVSSPEELLSIVNEEIEKVVNKPELREVFLKIDEALSKNQKLSDFKKVLENDNTILAKLSDYEAFKKDVWFSYLKQIEEEVVSLLNLYDEKNLN